MNDKIIETPNHGNNKGTPIDQALNKLREAKIKECQTKVDSQTKVAFDAKIVVIENLINLKSWWKNLNLKKQESTILPRLQNNYGKYNKLFFANRPFRQWFYL